MFKKLNWRIAALIVFMIAAGGFIYWNVSTVQQIKKQTALFEKMLEKEQKPVAANEPPPAAPGKKWVPHGDHFHEVPIDAPDVWQGGPHGPIVGVSNETQLQHEPVRTPPEQTEDVVMWDGRKWSEYSPEEKKAAKQQNELKIWVTYDLIKKSKEIVHDSHFLTIPNLSLPILKERYQVLTENPFPYTPEVHAQLDDITLRWGDAQREQARLWEEVDKKRETVQEEMNRKIEAMRQSGELDD